MGDIGLFYGLYFYRETQIGNKDVQRPDKVPSKVSIGVVPIEVEIPIDGESVNREDASGSNRNGN